MSETISQLPSGTAGALGDVIPLTQGSTGPGTGTTRKLTIAQVLSASEIIYAGNPAYSGGVLADGVTNDSAAWNAALSAASATGAVVIAPMGVSIASITVPSNVTIIGSNTQFYGATSAGEMTYPGFASGQGAGTLGAVIQAPTGSIAVTMGSFSNMFDMGVTAANGQPAIDASSGRAVIDNVVVTGGTIGISCNNATDPSKIRNCRIHHQSTAGINNPYGCCIENNTFNACGTAINLSAGSNYNLIVGNKAMFCTNASFSVNSAAAGAFYNVFTGNLSDRPGGNAFLLTNARYTTINGNGCFRSGRSGTGTGSSLEAHFALSGCDGIIITGNTSSVWGDDAGLAIGHNSPFYAIWNGNSAAANTANIMITGNILTFLNTGLVVNDTTGTPFSNINSTNNVLVPSAGRTV